MTRNCMTSFWHCTKAKKNSLYLEAFSKAKTQKRMLWLQAFAWWRFGQMWQWYIRESLLRCGIAGNSSNYWFQARWSCKKTLAKDLRRNMILMVSVSSCTTLKDNSLTYQSFQSRQMYKEKKSGQWQLDAMSQLQHLHAPMLWEICCRDKNNQIQRN